MPYNANTELIITETANELISLVDTLERLRIEMNRIASQLPEYPVVLSLHGVGTTLAPLTSKAVASPNEDLLHYEKHCLL